MDAIILAGGFGTRLKSVIGEEIPKPMADIGGEPFLAHYIRYLRTQGVTRVMLSVYYLRKHIMDYFKDHFEGVTVLYAEEEAPLGTGGALRFALSMLMPEAPVLVANGDSFVELDLQEMLAAHASAGAQLTIGLRKMPDCSRYGEVACDESGRITSFVYPGRAQAGFISTGMYIVNPDIFSGHDVPGAFSFEADFQRPFVESVHMHGHEIAGYFIDIGVPEDYARFQHEYKQFCKAAA
jgi:D-glycero-alpha-D-manno-heptose 1-phosphate guanylyltransferase